MDSGRKKRTRKAQRPASSLVAGYRPLAGVPDEMIDAGGSVRARSGSR